MLDYIIGIFLLVFMIGYFFLFGTAINKNVKSIPYNVIVGYIVHSFIIALGLIPVQLLKLDWNIGFVYTILVYVICLFISIILIRKKKIKLIENSLKDLIKQHYFLFGVTFLLFILFLMQLDLIWINNHLDDGFYFIKAATLPYEENPFSMNYSVGLYQDSLGLDTYALNVFEYEASVFIYLFKIDPSIFLRVVMNVFNYFLCTCTTYVLFERLCNNEKYKYLYQYSCIILLVFMFDGTALAKTGLLTIQDPWQFNSAIWYGSSIVRVLGLLWIILPFIGYKKITWKELLFVFIICVMLVSKSTIAIPVIFCAGISYLLAFFLTCKEKKWAFASLGIFGIVAIVGIILAGNEVRQSLIYAINEANRLSILIYGSLLMCILYTWRNRDNVTLRFMLIMIFYFILMNVPEINDVFETLSVYDFVARRAQTTWYYTFLALAFVCMLSLIYEFKDKLFIPMCCMMLLVSLAGSAISYYGVNGNPLRSYKIMLENPYLIPNSTRNLSLKLNELSQEEELNVMVPEWLFESGNRHSLAIIVRAYAPNINSISAIRRFPLREGSEFSSFGGEQQDIYEGFAAYPSEETYIALERLLAEYPINCLVFQNTAFEEYKERAGFELVAQSDQYYIYIKE